MLGPALDTRNADLIALMLGCKLVIKLGYWWTPAPVLLHGREMVLPVHNLHRIKAPEADSIDPTAETLVNNLQPLQDAWDNALVNISRKQAKMQRLYAEQQLHGRDICNRSVLLCMCTVQCCEQLGQCCNTC